MLRLLLISLGRAELPTWPLPEFQLECASGVEDGVRRLTHQPCDAVVLVVSGPIPRAPEVCSRLEAACGPDAVPLVLVADGRDLRATESLALLPFDAFIDSAWDARLVGRCLSLAINRVRAGRGVADIQQQVLRAVREEVAQLKDQSLRDELTGLYNLRSFHEVMPREHARCVRHRRTYALVCFDVDNLRELNNTHGHALGSRALARVGVALYTTTRQADYAFRVGGDEFITLLPEADHASARMFAERICSTLRQCVLTVPAAPGAAAERVRLNLSVSAGVAVFPRDGDTPEAVLARADAALYRAKSQGRDRTVLCDGAAA